MEDLVGAAPKKKLGFRATDAEVDAEILERVRARMRPKDRGPFD